MKIYLHSPTNLNILAHVSTASCINLTNKKEKNRLRRLTAVEGESCFEEGNAVQGNKCGNCSCSKVPMDWETLK